MQEGVQEALILYLRMASLDTIRQVLELVRGELEQRGIPFHFTLDESELLPGPEGKHRGLQEIALLQLR